VHREGKIGSSRRELDAWVRSLPQPRMMAILRDRLSDSGLI